MDSQRIKAGLHRVGIVVTVAAAIWPIIIFGALALGGRPDIRHASSAWLSLLVAILAYPASMAIAWIIDGFSGDDKNSN